jgi:hypothetical protein
VDRRALGDLPTLSRRAGRGRRAGEGDATTPGQARDLAQQYRELWKRTTPTDWRPHGRRPGAAAGDRRQRNKRWRARSRSFLREVVR